MQLQVLTSHPEPGATGPPPCWGLPCPWSACKAEECQWPVRPADKGLRSTDHRAPAGDPGPNLPGHRWREWSRYPPQDTAGRRGPGTCFSNQLPGEAMLLACRPCLGNYCSIACPGLAS